MSKVLDNFKSQFFPVHESLLRNYKDRVEAGLEKMRDTDVVICGLARDVAHCIHLTMDRMLQLGQKFNDFQIVLYENDSADATSYAIEGYVVRHGLEGKINVLGGSLGAPKNPQIRCLLRATRMAFYRNQVRQHIVASYPWAEKVIVIDTDIEGGWSNDGIATTFARTDWDFVGSNSIVFRDYGLEKSKPLYFDVWAFRWPGSDRPTRPEDINPRYWPNGTEMVPVNSCFGGLGIYRMEAFQRCSYDGTDCEHVPFHRRMREAGMGRLFMNPSQITHYGGEPVR